MIPTLFTDQLSASEALNVCQRCRPEKPEDRIYEEPDPWEPATAWDGTRAVAILLACSLMSLTLAYVICAKIFHWIF